MLDAHAHLTDARFASDLAAVLERARVAGVTRVLTCAEDLGSSEAAVALAERHPEVRVAVGVHPHRAATWSEATAVRLLELARQDRVVAIGEIGMDLSGRSAPLEEQERALRAQLALASLLEMPPRPRVPLGGCGARGSPRRGTRSSSGWPARAAGCCRAARRRARRSRSRRSPDARWCAAHAPPCP